MIGKLKELLDIPAAIMATFASSQIAGPRQTLITVTSEIRLKGDDIDAQLDALDRLIEKTLGNPAKGGFKDALDESGIIHFASLSVIRRAKDAPHEPSYLFLEMSADGTEVEILETLCEKTERFLEPVYTQANCLKNNETLLKHMKHNSVHLVQSAWPGFFAGHLRNGLGFSGTPGQSVRRVKSDNELAEKAREKLEQSDPGLSPAQTVEYVKQELLADGENIPLRNPPLFAEDEDSGWLKKGGLLKTFIDVFPPIYYAYIVVLFLTVASALWEIMYGSADKPTGLKHIPMNFSVRPEELPNLKLYLSATNLFWGLVGAFIGAVLLKVLSRKFNLYRLYSLGGIIWYVLIAYILLAFWRYADVFSSFGKGVLPTWGTVSLWMYALGITVVIYFVSKFLRHFSKIARTATWIALFLMIVLFAEVGLTHWQLFNLPTSDGGVYGLYNRWDNATFPQMFFYPYLYATLLVTSVLAVDAATPGIGTWMKYKVPQIPFIRNLTRGKVYVVLYFILHIIIWLAAFFSIEDAKAAWDNKRWILLSWVVLPVLIAVIAVSIYFWLNKTLKKTRNQFLLYVGVLAGVLVVIINFQDWSVLEDVFRMPNNTRLTWGNDQVLKLLLSLMAAIPVTLLTIVLTFGSLLLLLRFSEEKNIPSQKQASTDKVRDLMRHENQLGVQNHMLVIGRLLPEQFRRRFTLPVSLNIVKKRIAKHTRPGFLGRVNTVHYARWIHFPRTNNYGFFSNYDGSFESYMEDFVTQAPDGLNLVSAHTVGYPKTEFIVKKGAANGDAFKSYLRARFIAAPMWYSAYPHITAEQIRRNALIVQGLGSITTASDAEGWMNLFASMSRPQHALETHKIQSFVFGNAKRLQAGCCISVQCPDGKEKEFRKWIDSIRADITFGDQTPKENAIYLAFSNAGLAKLDITDFQESIEDTSVIEKNWEELEPDGGSLQKMNSAFSVGMDDPTRAKVLGDEGNHAPENWDWGSGDGTAHAVLLLYVEGNNAADAKQNLETLISGHQKSLSEFGLNHGPITHFQPTNPNDAYKEPFGFVDGVSQPILRGTRKADGNPDSIHLVEPGEIVLGYRDNRGYFPKSPILHATLDPDNILPTTPARQPRRYPKFELGNQEAARDFGRNGSFLVIRQLEQDYKRFETSTDNTAKEIGFGLTGEGLRAKLMGRWQDGTSLIKYPMKLRTSNNGPVFTHPGLKANEPDNEFLFGRDDPQGHACPFGSHVRRANPRDGLNPNDKDSLSIANRHRILRRGRSYYVGEQGDDKRYDIEGTFFMALNANIERQFEFVQQTWINSTKFHGLRDEKGPIASNEGAGKFTIQAPGKALEIDWLASYITMKGGGYFFLPGREALKYIASNNR